MSATDHGLPTPGPESPYRPRKPYRFATLCATVEHPDARHKDQHGSSAVPIYQTATFKGMGGEYDYTRSGNPTRTHLEHHIAKISDAKHAFAVSSGMAALDVILRRLKPGDEVIAGDDLYGGTNRLLKYLTTHGGVIVHHVDTTNSDLVIPYVRAGKTSMILLESPTNPLLKIVDIATISKEVKQRAPDAIVVVDNTMMSPYLQRPLEHGADIVYDSGTKYLSGHHDLMAGVIACNRDDLAQEMAFVINSVGNALSPFDSFLLLRGCKTLAVRMDRQQATALQVAKMLNQLGFEVYYPGLAGHPNRLVHERLSDGPGAVLSFTTGDKALSRRIVGATRLWGISVSFGCVNSLISMPCVMSHASIDATTRAARGLPEDLIRLCVGIEDPDDLICDLEHALFEAGGVMLSPDHEYVRTNFPEAISRAVGKLAFPGTTWETRDKDATEWLVSAPGKVILFGEHAVVHGVTALAAAVDLRCYGLTTPRYDRKIAVRFPGLNFNKEWDLDSLPWDAVTPIAPGGQPPDALDPVLVEAIREVLSGTESTAKNAALAFLYLFMITSHGDEQPAFTFTSRATLPIGAGLGSSASYSACAAAAILLLHKRISIQPSDEGQDHYAIPSSVADEVNRWAFIAEKILHGNPSGVDNCVAVYGGALAYTKPGFGKRSGMEPIAGFRFLKFLLTDSKIPRDTKSLVARVTSKRQKEPGYVNGILDKIQIISDEAQRLLTDDKLPRSKVLAALSELIDENHQHLVDLGVSHEALESIRTVTKTSPFGLSTKLTGAGGGGCTVTLVPDDFDQCNLDRLTANLTGAGFQPYLTSVGGSGLGILRPRARRDSNKQSPPMTPNLDAGAVPAEAHLSTMQVSFETISLPELDEWAQTCGRWLFV